MRHERVICGLAFVALLVAGRAEDNTTNNTTKKNGSKTSTTTRKSDESAQVRPEDKISLSQIVTGLNQVDFAGRNGRKLILRFEDGPFATVELNPQMWGLLTPLQQKAVGTGFAKAFGRTGGINCRFKVYGIEVGRVSLSFWGEWQYEPE